MIRIRIALGARTSSTCIQRARELRWTGRSTAHGRNNDIPDADKKTAKARERVYALRTDDRDGDHRRSGIGCGAELYRRGTARAGGGAAAGLMGDAAGNRQLHRG